MLQANIILLFNRSPTQGSATGSRYSFDSCSMNYLSEGVYSAISDIPNLSNSLSTFSADFSFRLTSPPFITDRTGNIYAIGEVKWRITLGFPSILREEVVPSATHLTNFLDWSLAQSTLRLLLTPTSPSSLMTGLCSFEAISLMRMMVLLRICSSIAGEVISILRVFSVYVNWNLHIFDRCSSQDLYPFLISAYKNCFSSDFFLILTSIAMEKAGDEGYPRVIPHFREDLLLGSPTPRLILRDEPLLSARERAVSIFLRWLESCLWAGEFRNYQTNELISLLSSPSSQLLKLSKECSESLLRNLCILRGEMISLEVTTQLARETMLCLTYLEPEGSYYLKQFYII